MKGHRRLIISNNFVKKTLEVAGKCLHSPEQRLILGATALMTQPAIDMKNENIDEKTRMTSVARTMAKIVVGTLVGVLIRAGGIALVSAFSKHIPIYKDAARSIVIGIIPDGKRGFLVPRFMKKPFMETPTVEFNKDYVRYKKAFGTLIATAVMVVTNFAVDAPLTKWLTNVFSKKITGESEKKKEKGVKT